MFQSLITPLLLFCGLIQGAAADTFKVGVRYLPTHLQPRQNQINTNHYIFLHIYYPLFSRDADGVLQSEFLDMSRTKATDTSFSSYLFCLREGIRFSDGKPITTFDVQSSILAMHKVQEGLPKLKAAKATGSCVLAELDRFDSGYFDRFVGVASTILESSSEKSDFPVGLGPYRVAEHSPTSLVLVANPKRVTGSFDRVEFLKWSEEKNPSALDDANHIYQKGPDPVAAARMQRIQTPLIKSYALVVNLPTVALRREFAACIDRREMKAAIRPDLNEPVGFLPSGVLGSQVNYDEIKARFGRCKDDFHAPIRFFALFPEEQLLANRFFSKAPAHLQKNIKVGYVPSEQLAKLIFDRTAKAVILGFDSSGSTGINSRESSVFFESFIRPERVISQVPQNLENLVDRAVQAEDEREKARLYQSAHRLLLESGYVIPLGQANSYQYYASDLRNIEWGDRLSGFPRIDKIERVKR